MLITLPAPGAYVAITYRSAFPGRADLPATGEVVSSEPGVLAMTVMGFPLTIATERLTSVRHLPRNTNTQPKENTMSTLTTTRPEAPVHVIVATRFLVKANRRDFVEAHPWAEGLSCLDIAIAVVHHGMPVTAPWMIGSRTAERASLATRAAKKAVAAHLNS